MVSGEWFASAGLGRRNRDDQRGTKRGRIGSWYTTTSKPKRCKCLGDSKTLCLGLRILFHVFVIHIGKDACVELLQNLSVVNSSEILSECSVSSLIKTQFAVL